MSEQEALEKAIAALEAQRATLGDAVVDTAIAALRREILASRPLPQEERKQVTVLFADLVGFTALAEKMDPEEVHEVLGAYFGRWKAAIARHEGMVEKFIGDAVVAVFGLPLAREDTPQQAVWAALEVRKELEELNRELERERGLHLAMRVGIHTGPALVRYERHGEEETFSVIGDTVNLAARLEQAAPVGGILISYEIFRQVRGLFEVTPQEPFLVKGKTKPVRTYLVHGPRRMTYWPAGRGLEGLETPMVGREQELATLQEAFHAVASGPEVRFLVAVGEAGVGKTRLLQEFERWLLALSSPTHICHARASPETTTIPYALLHTLFSLRFDILESDDGATVQAKFLQGMEPFLPAERALLVGQLAGFDFSAVPSIQALLGSPSLSQQALADLTLFFRSLSVSSPTVIFLEDLHWADNPSLDLFLRLSRELSGPLLILASARPDLFDRRPDLASMEGIVRLQPLPYLSCHALAKEILRRVKDLPPYLPEFLAGQAGGNPFFLEELVLMLIERGIIVPGDEHWEVRLERLEGWAVPSSLVALLQARLDALPPAEKALLQKASVGGRNFWDGLLLFLGEKEESIAALLESLVAREMVMPQVRSAFARTREYAFRHALLREVCYETVLLQKRRLYHRQVAEWLERQAGERQGEYAGLIGEHYERAGEKEQAALWLQRAGEQALQTSAFAEAVAAFERVLALLPEEEYAKRSNLLVRLGYAWAQTGAYSTATEHLQAGLTLARSIAEERITIEALSGLSMIASRRGDYQEARRLEKEALDMACSLGDCRLMALALRRLGIAAISLREYTEASRCFRESLTLYERIGEQEGIAACLNNLGVAALYLGDYGTATSYFERSLEIRRSLRDRWGIAGCYTNLGLLAHYQGNYTTAVRRYQASLALARELGDRQGIARNLSNLSQALIALKRNETAKRCCQEALTEAHAIGAIPLVLGTLAGLAEIAAHAGRHRWAAELLGLALHHPATNADVAKAAEPALSFLRTQMPAEALETALEEGKFLNLEDTIQELLAE